MSVLCVAAWCLAAFLAVGCSSSGEANRPQAGKGAAGGGTNPVVVIETSMGTIKAELWADKAPLTVTNFLRYTDEKFFDGLIFHRVKSGFMIQGGGYTPDMRPRRTHEQIRNEARADVSNRRGTLAMARQPGPHTATSQFFINLVDNGGLDKGAQSPEDPGYCVFGKVIEGMDVVDRIARVKCKLNDMGEVATPIETVEIKSVRRPE